MGILYSFIEISFNGGRVFMESFFAEVFGEFVVLLEDEEDEE
jgi:hypothetical protein